MANETSWAMLEAEVVDLMPGVTRLIEHLHANNVPIAISTGSTETSMKLKRAGHEKLFDKFEFIVCCSTDPEVKQGKPHPDAFDVARRRFNPIPDPEKCLAFEDSTNGVKSAISAGMQCVMVPDKRLKPEECANATIVLKSLEDFNPADFNLPPY